MSRFVVFSFCGMLDRSCFKFKLSAFMFSKLTKCISSQKVALFIFCLLASSCLSASVGPTDLMIAIESGQSPTTVQWLINNGEDVNEAYSEMLRALNPVLRYALDRGSDEETVEIIKILIEAGADVNAITYNRVTDERVYGMMPLISYAVIYSTPEIVEMFINSGADVNYKLSKTSIDGNKTALTYAQELGKEEVTDLLEMAGAI